MVEYLIISKINKKSIIILGILLSLALLLTIYTTNAYLVASHVHEYNGVLQWPTPGYSFLPWPHSPTGIVVSVLVPLNQMDLQYYNYIIKSGILLVITLIMWIIVLWRVLKLKQSLDLS